MDIKRFYSRAIISISTLLSYKFHIYLLDVYGFERKIYIFPSEFILNAPCAREIKKNKEYVSFYLPFEERLFYKKLAKINWWQYQNAWDLIK